MSSKILRFLGRFFIWLFTTLILVLGGAYVFFRMVNKGPSPHLRDLFVVSAMESSAGGILAKMYLSDEEISAILKKNSMKENDEITDTTLVSVMSAEKAASGSVSSDSADELLVSNDPDGDGIEVHDIKGAMYRGKMMVVLDPSRVRVSCIPSFTHGGGGWTLEQHINNNSAVGGINGGKYEDESGLGMGGWPEGIVIENGVLRQGDPGGTYGVYGFTKDNILVVGNMTAQQALNMGIRDAVSFGPALITNGKSASYQGVGGGLNPRTAIGQRADGAVLLLVIEGRRSTSLGAAMSDLIEVMEEYGAVNAANLDGGMSSSMILNGEKLVDNCQIRDSRRIPTAFIVDPPKAEGGDQ